MLEQLFNDEELTEKQKKILMAAIESFSEKGYAQTSTSEIAKKAGVAEGTIFRHYKTKRTLLFSIVTPLLTKFVGPYIVKDFQKLLDRNYDQFEDFLRDAIENRREVIMKNAPIIKILLQEIPFQDELRTKLINDIFKPTFEHFIQVIETFQKNGKLRGDMPPATIVRLLFSNIFGYLVPRYLFLDHLNWDDEMETERTIEFIMHGLRKE